MRPARLAAAGLGLLLTVAPAAAASASVDVAWTGPTLALAWDGSTRASAESSFVGVPVTVPGDRAVRGVTVRNDGPTGGTLRAWVEQVDLLDAPSGLDDSFYDDLRLDWHTVTQSGGASFAALADAGRTLIAQTHLAQGASTQLQVAYELPAAATSGNRSEVGARQASFVVRVQIQGDTTSPEPTATASPTPGAPDGPGVPGDSGAGAGVPGDSGAGTGGGIAAAPRSGAAALAITGIDLLRGALLAVVGIGLGSLLLGAARRRREVQHPGGDSFTPSAG
ncbi:hypothetical protein Cfla_2634 [Cellulomonas flavigena DSM 20109]|uniref:Uncharacterized protein n=1 Tax=Cellulomonas flavigena (strain ATCC 482 / DSM 20109 / BCRC 11376 / JCM 18109 / NBRC 3775 / NCIMB 8073 / NRS 134) TaxID=446466 RepID=D5UIV5_CELFN|nr:hypothetical protein [Cellulomonas flavigena]ADG75521.1 hypothetical protein Cfla_2634 [Cellulomonas flavigena DSM 20109]